MQGVVQQKVRYFVFFRAPHCKSCAAKNTMHRRCFSSLPKGTILGAFQNDLCDYGPLLASTCLVAGH